MYLVDINQRFSRNQIFGFQIHLQHLQNPAKEKNEVRKHTGPFLDENSTTAIVDNICFVYTCYFSTDVLKSHQSKESFQCFQSARQKFSEIFPLQ